MQVWSDAASPHGPLAIQEYFYCGMDETRKDESFHAMFLVFTRPSVVSTLPTIIENNLIGKRRKNIRDATAARSRLLGTCRLSLQMVLEAWVEDVHVIPRHIIFKDFSRFGEAEKKTGVSESTSSVNSCSLSRRCS